MGYHKNASNWVSKTILTMMMMTKTKTFDGDGDDDDEDADDDADTCADVALPCDIQVCSSSNDGRTHNKA